MVPSAIDVDPHSLQNDRVGRFASRLYSVSQPPSLATLEFFCTQRIQEEAYPLASCIQSNVPIYELSGLSHSAANVTEKLQDEWHHILLSGPGVLVLKDLFSDRALLTRVNEVFSSIIQSELQWSNGSSKGDHFAASGKNSRIWNSFQKHGKSDPESFVQYYSNPWLALMCAAWLGPAYRITAQVNVVKPGGPAQVSHRDYHLGFQSTEQCAQYPKAIQIASQLLTLQGGVAHCDMPLESGPTRFLPFSQRFEEGFMAYRLPEFQNFFENKYIALPLRMGDAVFFNPAIFHAAGENRTANLERSANLLQVSSAFGKTMETIDSITLVAKCWDSLQAKHRREGMTAEVTAFIAAVGEGYPFPLNLDNRAPAPGGMAPESEQDLLMRGLQRDWNVNEVLDQLKFMREDSLP